MCRCTSFGTLNFPNFDLSQFQFYLKKHQPIFRDKAFHGVSNNGRTYNLTVLSVLVTTSPRSIEHLHQRNVQKRLTYKAHAEINSLQLEWTSRIAYVRSTIRIFWHGNDLTMFAVYYKIFGQTSKHFWSREVTTSSEGISRVSRMYNFDIRT